MRILLLLLGLACAGCAPARVSAPPATPPAAADALLREGCYDCLLEAQALYVAAAAGPASPALALRRFEVALLIAMRERELALDDRASFSRLDALAQALPDSGAAARVVALARGLSPDPATVSFLGQPSASFPATLPLHDDDRAWLATSFLSPGVSGYLSAALACDDQPQRRRDLPGTASGEAVAASSDLVAYRTSICQARNKEALAALRSRSPRFVELGLFQARTEMRSIAEGGAYRARALLADVYARFPTSPAVTYLRGHTLQVGGDCRAAVSAYDETLALNPGHEQAQLGRTICLSYLARHDEAIAAASVLIDAATRNQGEAWYWRAWNRRELKDLAAARTDSDRAKQLGYNTTVLTLAGMIEYDQDDLDGATRDLREAVAIGPTNCAARWYLALVQLKQTSWEPSASTFATAMECYERGADDTEARKAAVLAQKDFDLDPEYVKQQVTGFNAAIAEDRAQQSAAAYNAAVNYARARDYDRAERYAALAERDAARKPRVDDLRKAIEAARAPR